MMAKNLLVILLFAYLFAFKSTASEAPEALMMADFNKGNQNALGGYFNRFERDPSKATVGLTRAVFLGDNGKSMEVRAQRHLEGFCGAWIHFFDFRIEDRKYFDASPYAYLSFWVKGEKGGEKFSVKIADKRLIEIEDSAHIGCITKYLPDGVTQQWQEVHVPFNQLRNVDKGKLGGITFDFDSPGDHSIYIDDIVFKKSKDSMITPAILNTTKTSEAISLQRRTLPLRTMWVWTVFEILENKNNEQDSVFEACERENTNRLWLQIPIRHESNVDLGADIKEIQPREFKVSLQHEDKLKAFIRKAHAKGIKIEALDGYPEFAQKPYHFMPLAIVDAIIDYNNRAEPEERFAGVHFDNEPYLIIGWHDKNRREQILKEFLELNIECQRRIHANSDMEFGVDIPFWWNANDPTTGEAIGEVTFNKERKPAVYFCIDFLDNIGIMNYRDTTYGVDGIIAHADPILQYAERAGKARVYVGLEVFRYKPTEIWFPIGLPRETFINALQTNANKFSYLSRINGFRTQLIDDGVNIHVGIELPPNPDEVMQREINGTVVEMARYLGITSDNNLSIRDHEKVSMNVKKEISRSPEWRDYRSANIIDNETSQEYPGFKAFSVMLGKTTFADESYDEFKKQLTRAENELINYPAYVGTAIHYFKVLDEKFHKQNTVASVSTMKD
ncbi:MAG: hypothetical protein ACN4GF_02095 [Lentimonas sp.]